LIETLGWPTAWAPMMRHFASLTRAEMRSQFKAFCDARPVGGKFAHRATDLPAGSSSSMKWVNPPVAYMLHAGVPRLQEAGVTLVGMQAGDPQRLAFDAGNHADALIDDGSADLLDAVLCAILAAWAWQRRDAGFGLPAFDPLEGWIVGA
jgi:hypothetical protein